jgi:hypothetical protein
MDPIRGSYMSIRGFDKSGISEIFSIYVEFPWLCGFGKVHHVSNHMISALYYSLLSGFDVPVISR